MTQAAVNNAKVLYRLSVRREDVERAESLFFLTPALKKVLESPVIPADKKNAVITKVFTAESFPNELIQFLKVMCKNGDIQEMQDIFKAYYLYWDEQNHIIRADLIYAAPPTEEEVKAAKHLLESKYPNCIIVMTQKIDEELIGGYKICTCHKEYDRSFEERLCQIERKLTGR